MEQIKNPFVTEIPLYDYNIEYNYSYLPDDLKAIILELEKFDKVGDWFNYDMKFPELSAMVKSYLNTGIITEYDYRTILKKYGLVCDKDRDF